MFLKTYRNIVFGLLIMIGINTSQSPAQMKKYWVYFVDKGQSVSSVVSLSKESPEYRNTLEFIQPQALERRAKVLPRESLITIADLPLYEPYLKHIQTLGGEIVHHSRWLNAASIFLRSSQIASVQRLPFVAKIQPVIIFRGKTNKHPSAPQLEQLSNNIDYGQSYNQIQMINVAPLHTAGITGRGVLVGMLDSGFRWRAHEALQSCRVIAEHDFIFNDDVTSNQDGDSNIQDAHGTLTFSIVGGYKPGKLIGAAFDAAFLLGKTEYIPSEYQIEEDHWAAAIEWMESRGVDVVSSSVGYDLFDDGTGYYWEQGDFNGRTSVVAQAALHAAQLGVVVCASMGNEGNGDGIVGTLLTPADADSVISVGGVSFDRRLAVFSSTGPTNDGRIKPDVVAPGVGIYHATIPGPKTYGSSTGNSVSTPLVAGTVALMLSARPELTPIQVRDALRSTAESVDTITHPGYPNNFIGWGLIDAFKAATLFGPILSNQPEVQIETGQMIVLTSVVSKYGIVSDSVIFNYSIGGDSDITQIAMVFDSSMFYPTSGKYRVIVPPQKVGTPLRFFIEARDSAGNSYTSPPFGQESWWWLLYGIPWLQSNFSNQPEVQIETGQMIVSTSVVSKYGIVSDSVIFNYSIGDDSDITQIAMVLDSSMFYPTSGKYRVIVPPQKLGTPVRFFIEARDSAGNSYTSPPFGQESWWWLLYGIPGLQSHEPVTAGTVLHQNYPNPFYSTPSLPGGWIPANVTLIPLDLSKSGHVLVKVYNALGEEIATVADEIFEEGQHTIFWDASNQPSGVYFYRLSTSSGSEVKKMIFIR